VKFVKFLCAGPRFTVNCRYSKFQKFSYRVGAILLNFLKLLLCRYLTNTVNRGLAQRNGFHCVKITHERNLWEKLQRKICNLPQAGLTPVCYQFFELFQGVYTICKRGPHQALLFSFHQTRNYLLLFYLMVHDRKR